MRIGRTFKFDAAHFLPGHPKCGAVHGHTWKVDVVIEGYTQTVTGMVLDFHILKEIVAPIIKEHDHTALNDLYPLPTVENLAKSVCRQIAKDLVGRENVFGVRATIQEGDGGWAECILRRDPERGFTERV